MEIAKVFLVLANAAVWIGVYLEKDTFSKETQSKGWRLLLVGLAAETLFTIIALTGDARLAARQNEAIRTLTKSAAHARQEILDQQPRELRRLLLSAGQTHVTLPVGSVVTFIALNGVMMERDVDYSVSGNTVTLTPPVLAGTTFAAYGSKSHEQQQ